jgi:hypothetical protein
MSDSPDRHVQSGLEPLKGMVTTDVGPIKERGRFSQFCAPYLPQSPSFAKTGYSDMNHASPDGTHI